MLFQLLSRAAGTLLFLSLLFIPAIAQDVKISGTVLDAQSRQALDFANVSLLSQADSSLVRGALTESEGDFSLTAPEGEYLVRFSFIGYRTQYRPVTVKAGRPLKLEPALLDTDAEVLTQVTVTGIRSMFQNDTDKRVYNVENSTIAQGGTAIDLLETLPSIQVDEEGGISMRGSGNILILINGRPTSLSGDDTESILAQFPANSIKSVEIITNPSSRYDAAGIGGIINIILKQNQRIGFNGQMDVSAGTRHKYTGGVNLNYGLPNLNFFANYNYQYRELFELSNSRRFSFAGQVSPQLDQDFNTTNTQQGHLLRTGFDYSPGDKVRLGFYFQNNDNDRDRLRIYNQIHINDLRQPDSLIVRTLNEDARSINREAGFQFDWDIDSTGQKLYIGSSYSKDRQDRVELFDQLYFYNNDTQPARLEDQVYARPRSTDQWVLQLDYTKPFSGKARFEAGLKSTLSYFDNLQRFEILDPLTGFYQNVDTISNAFRFEEIVHAAYLSYRNQLGRLGLQAGLRPELTLTNSFETNTGNAVVNNYFNVFPSLFLSYDLGEEESLSVNYSRRISRPSTFALAPFYNAQDLLNMRLGNPLLQPEFTDSYELGYTRRFDFLFFTGTLYHRHTTDLMTRIFLLNDNNSAIQTWDNANRRLSNGLELINQFFPAQWIDLTLSGNFFHSHIIADNVGEGFRNENFSWTLSLLGSFRAGKWGNFQLQGNYRGPIVLPQGEIEPMYGFNIGYRKDLLNRKATLSINVSDVFNTRIFRTSTLDSRFIQTRTFNRETRIGTIAFTWRFGGFRDRGRERRERTGDDIGDDPF